MKRKIIKKQGVSSEEREDYVAAEKKLFLYAGDREILSLYCTPYMIKELIAGLLITEEWITGDLRLSESTVSYNDIITVHLPVSAGMALENVPLTRCLGGLVLNRERTYRIIQDGFILPVNDLLTIFKLFQEKSGLFRLTGCFHSAAVSDGKTILAFAEDIGRHNAVDKVIGYCVLNNIAPGRKLMIVSCRLSSEILSKCAQWGVPILASRGAPTDLAIQIAEKSGMTLIGFVRGESFNIYTHAQRVL